MMSPAVSKLVSLFSPSEGEHPGTTRNSQSVVTGTSLNGQSVVSGSTLNGVGGGNMNNTNNPNRGFLPLFVSSQIVGLLSIILVITWTSYYLGGLSWTNPGTRFNWHPLLMVVGLVYLYGNSILIYRVLRHEPKPRLKLIHGGINALAFLFAVIGLIAVFSFHNDLNIPNMYSLHSWIGLGTVVLFGTQLVAGAATFLYPKTPGHIRATVLPLHLFAGSAIFVLAVITCVSGITEKAIFKLQPGGYGKLPGEAYVLNFVGTSIVLFALLVGFLVTLPDYKRRPLPEEQQLSMSMSSTRETIN